MQAMAVYKKNKCSHTLNNRIFNSYILTHPIQKINSE
nr:MAG TPA: hypothetical protein [Caudoviricetes sp.]